MASGNKPSQNTLKVEIQCLGEFNLLRRTNYFSGLAACFCRFLKVLVTMDVSNRWTKTSFRVFSQCAAVRRPAVLPRGSEARLLLQPSHDPGDSAFGLRPGAQESALEPLAGCRPCFPRCV